MLDEYKYPLTKLLSYDQIAAMRKSLHQTSNASAAKKEEKSYSCNESKR